MSDTPTEAGDVFDVDNIRRLVELMEEHDLSEVDLKQNERRIRVRRGAPFNAPPLPAAPMAAAAPLQPAAAPVDETPSHIVTINSPMVGTFYTKPNPDAEAFVRLGDTIDQETTVCIIEAMKVFNEIPAEVSGKIVAILVDDEEAVEFGKPLFKVDTSV